MGFLSVRGLINELIQNHNDMQIGMIVGVITGSGLAIQIYHMCPSS